MREEKKGSKLKEYLYSLLHGLKHVVLHNGWLKFIAVLISVILWAGVISQDTQEQRIYRCQRPERDAERRQYCCRCSAETV